jgi:hypothetical protein
LIDYLDDAEDGVKLLWCSKDLSYLSIFIQVQIGLAVPEYLEILK